MLNDGETDARKLNKLEKALQIIEESAESDVGDAGMEARPDHRGCGQHGPERKSTSGGMMMIHGTVVELWWRTQGLLALGTAEAECKRLKTDLWLSARVRVWTDSNAEE